MQVHNYLVNSKGEQETYGFLETQHIQRSGNKRTNIQNCIQRWISKSEKRIYFAPIIHG